MVAKAAELWKGGTSVLVDDMETDFNTYAIFDLSNIWLITRLPYAILSPK